MGWTSTSWRISSRIASKITLNCSSYRLSSCRIFAANSLLDCIHLRNAANVRIMAMLVSIARGLFNMPESMATPCSVKAKGRYLVCSPRFKVPFWLLREACSSGVNSNIKSSGNRSIFLRTARFKALVSTPYKSAKSVSKSTFHSVKSRFWWK